MLEEQRAVCDGLEREAEECRAARTELEMKIEALGVRICRETGFACGCEVVGSLAPDPRTRSRPFLVVLVGVCVTRAVLRNCPAPKRVKAVRASSSGEPVSFSLD